MQSLAGLSREVFERLTLDRPAGAGTVPTLRFPSPQKIIDPNGPWYNLPGQVRADGGVGPPLPPSRSR